MVDPYFSNSQIGKNVLDVHGLHHFKKTTSALRLLVYVNAADSIDKNVKIGETTDLECFDRFFEGVYQCFGEVCLKSAA